MSKSITTITIEVTGPKRSSALTMAIAKAHQIVRGLYDARGVTQVSVNIAQREIESSDSMQSDMTQP